MTTTEIARWVYNARNSKDWTQGQLAKRGNVSVDTVSEWERGKQLENVARFMSLMECMGLEITTRKCTDRTPRHAIHIRGLPG